MTGWLSVDGLAGKNACGDITEGHAGTECDAAAGVMAVHDAVHIIAHSEQPRNRRAVFVDSALLPRMLRPIVEQVARTTQEHVSVGVRDGDDIVHVVRSRYSHITSMSIRPGSRVPMYCTGSGRLWLASFSPEALCAYFQRNPPRAITPYTLTDEALIRREIALAGERGYVMVDQEYEVGMRVLSVPLIDREGQLQATLTLTTHASRMTVEDMRERYLSPLYEGQALLRPIMTL